MMTGWWFSEAPTLPNGDGREVKVGDWLEVEGDIVLCKRGLHFSRRAIDALAYARGPLCWYVEADGTVIEGDDKVVCSRRRALWMEDAEQVLRRFARSCALDVVPFWDAPEIVREYLATGDESKRAAAWTAAWAAARDDAWDAAWAAAWAAARDDAWDAAMAAARAAARAAAWDAAMAAARAAAWAAARDAAREAQNSRLEAMLHAYHDGTLDLSAPLEVPAR
jgi:hypothetical protein